MKRLRDEPPHEPLEHEMVRLLRSGQAAEPRPFAEQRIFATITRPKPRTRLGATRYAIALAMLLAMSAIASAWVAHTVVEHRRAEAQRVAALDADRRRHEARVVEPVGEPVSAPTVVEPPLAIESPPAVIEAPVVIRAPRAHTRALSTEPATVEPAPLTQIDAPAEHEVVLLPTSREVGAPPITSAPTTPLRIVDPIVVPRPAQAAPSLRAALLVDARIALAHGDSHTAVALSEKYVHENPRGALVEEAFALAIEAHNALHDGRGAAKAAHRYLEQFPQGRFSELAIRTTK